MIRRSPRFISGISDILSSTSNMPIRSREALWISESFYMLELLPFLRQRYTHGYGWTHTEHATLTQLRPLISKTGSRRLRHSFNLGTPSSSMLIPTISMGTCAFQLSGTKWLRKRISQPLTLLLRVMSLGEWRSRSFSVTHAMSLCTCFCSCTIT